MPAVRATDIIAASKESFDGAVERGVARVFRSLDGATGAWVQDYKITIENQESSEYRVNLKLTFILQH